MLREEQTGGFLWQAKTAKGGYHEAMTDKMFMDWLTYDLNTALGKLFSGNMIPVLNNARYHHVCGVEVKFLSPT